MSSGSRLRPSRSTVVIGLTAGVATYSVLAAQGANHALAVAVGLATFMVMTGVLGFGRRQP